MEPVIPDEEIVRTFQETGRNDCFAELFARHRRRVFSACRGFFTDSGAAEDATQETFLRAYQKMHTFQGGSFIGWLMRIARNVCVDQWRKRRLEAGTEGSEVAEGSAPVGPDPSSETHLMVERVWQGIKSLPPSQRQCLELRIQGYSYKEIAARAGLSIEAVKSHVQNGRRMLWLKMEGMIARLK